jgi:glucose-6-phosphate 1-dehydrogenase
MTARQLQEENRTLLRENNELRAEVRDLKGYVDLLECTLNEEGSESRVKIMDEKQDAENASVDPEKVLTIVVFGASGDLAKKKTFPALFALFKRDLLPKDVLIWGYARSKLSNEEFISKCVNTTIKNGGDKLAEFNKRCHYFSGQYDSAASFQDFNKHLLEAEKFKSKGANRVFYMALPPSVFVATAGEIRSQCKTTSGWNRVIVEKPFGKDTESSAALNKALGALFNEDEIFRIDHYLGKEMVQNLMVLRFANTVFEPLWNHQHIANVRITFKEPFGTEGRGGYFDEFGILRDVMQNHLIQIMSLVAMEPPVSLLAEDIRDEKVKVLRAVPPLDLKNIVVGQYTREGNNPGYLEDEGVPPNSTCPTFATAVLTVNNQRWSGVPFILKCGKALNERKAEIRIQFKDNNNFLFPGAAPNELVMRLQPNEAIYMKMMMKTPGLSSALVQSELDLSYFTRFQKEIEGGLPDAYERLILDVVRGDHNLFVRVDELQAAWRIFTPVLHQLEGEKIKPKEYSFGSRGPPEADDLAVRNGFVRSEGYHWPGNKKQ